MRLFVIRLFLAILVFIDFLEDLPARTIKYFWRSVLLTVFFVFYFIFIFSQAKSHQIENFLTYVLIPEYKNPSFQQTSYPILIKNIPFPEVNVKSLLVYDAKNHKVLQEINSDLPLPPASTTKLMTALVSMDLYGLNDYLEVPKKCTLINTQKIEFLAGERLSVNDLVHSLLVNSAGDAACTLANGKTTEEEFVALMNKKAVELELKNTLFSNPIGLDSAENQHYSSARNLLIISEAAVRDKFLKKVVGTKEYDIQSSQVTRKIFNTNDLLWDVPGTVGIKTGRTYGAGEVLLYQYVQKGVNIIIIVMGSADRFGDTKKILDWTLKSYYFGV